MVNNVTFYHIYGHQDRSTPWHLLSKDAQLNCMVDEMAQTALDAAYETDTFHQNPTFNYEGWSAAIGGVKLHDNHKMQLRDWVGKKRLREYLYQRQLIAWSIFPRINFTPLQHYLEHQSQQFQLWYKHKLQRKFVVKLKFTIWRLLLWT